MPSDATPTSAPTVTSENADTDATRTPATSTGTASGSCTPKKQPGGRYPTATRRRGDRDRHGVEGLGDAAHEQRHR